MCGVCVCVFFLERLSPSASCSVSPFLPYTPHAHTLPNQKARTERIKRKSHHSKDPAFLTWYLAVLKETTDTNTTDLCGQDTINRVGVDINGSHEGAPW